jgi:hypothetical protein
MKLLNRIFHLPSEELACRNSYQTYSCAGRFDASGPGPPVSVSPSPLTYFLVQEVLVRPSYRKEFTVP